MRPSPILLAIVATQSAAAQRESRLQIVSGVDAIGAPTKVWQHMLGERVSPTELDSIVTLRRRRTREETDWAALIESRRAEWNREIRTLAAPFSPATPPALATIVLGNVGGSDAFAADSVTIGFDLSQLLASYGPAGAAANVGLIDRLFRHEYTHIMQKAWLRQHPWHAETPLQGALVDIWLEGQGNYYSLSDRWRRDTGGRASAADQALSTLEPRFVVRLAALACTAADRSASIRQGLSAGRFEQKWGALPVALWLEDEHAASIDGLRRLIEAGPEGVWDLAARHLSEPLRGALNEARALESECRRPR